MLTGDKHSSLIIVNDPLSETAFLVNQVYLMIMHTKLSEYLYQMSTGEDRVGSKQSGERERERKRAVD
jgi:hypothetical protein